MAGQPWAAGPREILEHGLSLVRKDTDVSRRLALLAIDNAVELTAKTFLGLPKRVTGIQIGRKAFAEISESFPKMLDALEEHAADRLDGIELGEIEWFHRLRNQLYHQGNGLTVDRDKVEIYAELAKLLFSNLFGDELEVVADDGYERVGEFLTAWVDFERTMGELSRRHVDKLPTLKGRPRPPLSAIRDLIRAGVVRPHDAEKVDRLRDLRNRVVHGQVDHATAITDAVVADLREVTARYQADLQDVADTEQAPS